jgi:RNA-directed DNA polymerase
MNKKKEAKLIEVPLEAIQVREIQWLQSWIEPSIWSLRMLIALVTGVKGGKWYSLMDKVANRENLMAAFRKVKRNKGKAGVDHQTIEMFERRLDYNIDKLYQSLKEGRYMPQKILRKWIPKPGKRNEKRPLGIPTVRDRVVQTALRNVIEPIFEMTFAPQSYGFRPGRSCKDALRQVDTLLKEGYTWVLDADLKSYFDTIPHSLLLEQIQRKITDKKVVGLIEGFLKQEILETMREWEPDRGTPQGAVISPLLSNIYLDPLDQEMAKSGYHMVRYADDFVVLCQSETACRKAGKLIMDWANRAGLVLHPDKTKIVDATQPGGFDFLGYRFEQGQRWPSKKNEKRLKDTIRGRTKRCNGKSMDAIIADLNKILPGWFEYFKQSHRFIFERLDRWIRVRLRSILRKRIGLRGRSRGMDHHRWPNAYFGELGLYSLSTAWAKAYQSVKR